jgi:hypothetical protein
MSRFLFSDTYDSVKSIIQRYYHQTSVVSCFEPSCAQCSDDAAPIVAGVLDWQSKRGVYFT